MKTDTPENSEAGKASPEPDARGEALSRRGQGKGFVARMQSSDDDEVNESSSSTLPGTEEVKDERERVLEQRGQGKGLRSMQFTSRDRILHEYWL